MNQFNSLDEAKQKLDEMISSFDQIKDKYLLRTTSNLDIEDHDLLMLFLNDCVGLMASVAVIKEFNDTAIEDKSQTVYDRVRRLPQEILSYIESLKVRQESFF